MSTPLADAERVAHDVLRALAPWCSRIQIAGSIRRQKAHVKDIEIVAIPKLVPDGLFGDERLAVQELRDAALLLGKRSKAGDKMVQVENVLGSGITVDLFMTTPPATWGAQLAIRTGPAPYSEMLVTRIKNRGWRCLDLQVTDGRGTIVRTDTEEEFFAAARVEFTAPEHRNG